MNEKSTGLNWWGMWLFKLLDLYDLYEITKVMKMIISNKLGIGLDKLNHNKGYADSKYWLVELFEKFGANFWLVALVIVYCDN